MWFPDARWRSCCRRNIRLLLFIGWFAPVCWTPPLPPPSLFYRIIFINGTHSLLLCRCLLFRSPVLGLVFFPDHWSSRLKRTSPFCKQIYDICIICHIYIYILCIIMCWWQSGGAGGVRSEYTRGMPGESNVHWWIESGVNPRLSFLSFKLYRYNRS